MEIEYFGANAVIIKSGNAVITVDPKLNSLGVKNLPVKDTIELVTHRRFAVDDNQKILIDGPGEYEISNVSIKGIAAQQHIDEDGTRATIYRVIVGGYRIAIMGHIDPKLDEDQLESIGVVDIVIIPIGGGGYTLDAHAAASIVKHIDPKVVIPTHYYDKGLKYEVPQQELEAFTKELGSVTHETTAKYKLKAGSSLADTLTLVHLTRA
jgi:L-ascorbate metabolism protein UlaG (beta-lactamase superfamily)